NRVLKDKCFLLSSNSNKSYNFDSKVEENFLMHFKQLRSGWELVREPAPIILPSGNAFIADFMFLKYGIQIYFEIIGYWTIDYLKRKFDKLNKLLISETKYDFLIAIDKDNMVTGDLNLKNLLSDSLKIIGKEKIIIYNKNSIPLKPVINYLRSKDKKVISQTSEIYRSEISDFIKNLTKQNIDIINLEEISTKFSVPIDSIFSILSDQAKSSFTNEYTLLSTLLISNNIIHTIKQQINDEFDFKKIQQIFKTNKIPDFCHLDLIQFYGFEIIWKGLGSSDILLQKK
ncbi:MAG: DUF790 family protein, partial [Nitrososphaeraceae archaeon]|nr:DUF790 family protein [Nitrososphaeraceae archaeon]